jgi:hypothetical protein
LSQENIKGQESLKIFVLLIQKKNMGKASFLPAFHIFEFKEMVNLIK